MLHCPQVEFWNIWVGWSDFFYLFILIKYLRKCTKFGCIFHNFSHKIPNPIWQKLSAFLEELSFSSHDISTPSRVSEPEEDHPTWRSILDEMRYFIIPLRPYSPTSHIRKSVIRNRLLSGHENLRCDWRKSIFCRNILLNFKIKTYVIWVSECLICSLHEFG